MLLIPLDKLELALSLARESLPRPLACELLGAAVRFAELHYPANYARYNPGSMFRRAFADSAYVFHAEPVADAVGDIFQVAAITLLLAQYAQLEQGATLLVDVFQQPDKIEREGVPCVSLAFDGFGSFPALFMLGDGMTLTFDELQARWTLATRGGRIDKAPNGLLLRLTGVRALPEADNVPEPVLAAIEKAADACDKHPESARTLLDDALALIDGSVAPEFADIKALVRDVVRENQTAIESRGIVAELMFATDLPPIPIRRGPMRGLFKRILAYAADANTARAAVSILFDYDVSRRAAVFVATIAGVQTAPAHAALIASMRRTAVNLHGGAFETTSAASEITITISIPDPVGKALHDEFPGFDSFSGQSRRILRLLNSGGPTPPPELLIEGVLEEELARWLMPQLETPAAVNIAHEIVCADAVASPERLKKAIDQIRKGKPKRELARPPFAAEIIWAYRTDARRRSAIAAGDLSQSDLEELAKALTSPATADTLRLCRRLVAKRKSGEAI